MSWVHVFTVGVAHVLNVCRELKERRVSGAVLSDVEREFIEVVDSALKVVPGSEEERLVEARLRKLQDVVLERLRSNLRISAELNAYVGLIEEDPTLRASRIHLLVTATGLGRFSGEILRKVIREQLGTPCEVHVIGRWGWGPEYFDEALAQLMDTASRLITRAKEEGFNVALNLTGGFKPESSFLYVLATLYDVDLVYYIHETFRKVVTLPVLKLCLDPELAKKILCIFGTRDVVPASELPKELKARGIVRERGESESYTIRPWIKYLLKKKFVEGIKVVDDTVQIDPRNLITGYVYEVEVKGRQLMIVKRDEKTVDIYEVE